MHFAQRALHFVELSVRQQVPEMRRLSASECHNDDALIRSDIAFRIPSAQKLEILQAKCSNRWVEWCAYSDKRSVQPALASRRC